MRDHYSLSIRTYLNEYSLPPVSCHYTNLFSVGAVCFLLPYFSALSDPYIQHNYHPSHRLSTVSLLFFYCYKNQHSYSKIYITHASRAHAKTTDYHAIFQQVSALFSYLLTNIVFTLQSLEDKTARMRKDYEERLEALAESKRQALREMNNMFEQKLEEKDFMLQEVSITRTLLVQIEFKNQMYLRNVDIVLL